MRLGIVGFEAIGRHGTLGVVVEVTRRRGDIPSFVVCGGVSRSLVYHVPWACVLRVSPEERRVVLDLDLVDFDPSLREDGTVELRLARPDLARPDEGDGEQPRLNGS